VKLILQTCREQQRKTNRGPYSFGRTTSWSTDTVPGNGYGNPAKFTGMICSTFRPSDDATIYLYLIPSNLFAVTSFRQLAEMLSVIAHDESLADEFKTLANEVEVAVNQHGISDHPKYGKIYAYEADGFGNQLFMDDAGIPGLLSLPYLGCVDVNDPVYQNTRKFILSEDNPYFFKGRAGEGLGSPHTLADNIWPMGIISRILSSTDDREILLQLKTLKHTHAGTGFIHESFNKHDPAKYSRSWFAWVNTLFGEAILKIEAERPHLLKKDLG
ncbi:MAG: glycoside hydrolase family 125 protein, partial [Bacteroidota bacterium]